jgi:hypothetical protein
MMRSCYIKYSDGQRMKCKELIITILRDHSQILNDQDLYSAYVHFVVLSFIEIR